MRALVSITGTLLVAAVGHAAQPKLHRLEAGPADGLPVLLLHGARFDSGTWKQLGTLERLAKEGFHAIALDLPGYGESPPGPPLDLAQFITDAKLAKPVVLAPSMSGRVALPFVTAHPDQVAGFVAVAPVDLPAYEKALRQLALPTLIVWGDGDQVVPVAQANALHEWVKGSRLVILKGARHPCYLDRPDEFHAALIDFVRSVAAHGKK
jgi:pimeloyl-ACP methyl ester carboxylesterase